MHLNYIKQVILLNTILIVYVNILAPEIHEYY